MKTSENQLDSIIDEYKKSKPWQFEGLRDEPLSEQYLAEVEQAKGILLPTAYKQHLCKEGAGEFAFGTVYSPDDQSGWSLWKEYEFLPDHRDTLLPFSDNGGGDYYCFQICDGICDDRIVWADHEANYQMLPSDIEDFREFVLKVCLNRNAD